MRDLLKQVAQPQGDNTTFIYGLIDPRTGYVRYIGKANRPKVRLGLHLIPYQLKENNHRTHWLRNLLSNGHRPRLVILEEVAQSSWQQAEKKWIRIFRNIPNYAALTNSTDGGEGIEGYCPSEEERIRRSIFMTGRKMPPGTGQKISDANRGKPKSIETRIRFSEGQRNRWSKASVEQRHKMLKNLRNPQSEERRIDSSVRAMNAPRNPDATSKYHGVAKIPRAKPWRASCTLNKTFKYIGLFATEEEAARARDRFVLTHIGERAPLNFPRSDYAGVDIPICLPDKQE